MTDRIQSYYTFRIRITYGVQRSNTKNKRAINVSSSSLSHNEFVHLAKYTKTFKEPCFTA